VITRLRLGCRHSADLRLNLGLAIGKFPDSRQPTIFKEMNSVDIHWYATSGYVGIT